MEQKIKHQLIEILKKQKVVFAYLFGSQAKGSVGLLSDIDIAVYFNKEISAQDYFDAKLALLGDFISLFKREDIDVIVLNNAPPLLAHRILKEGTTIFSDNEKIRLEYETRAILRYLDWKPHLQQYAREVFGSI